MGKGLLFILSLGKEEEYFKWCFESGGVSLCKPAISKIENIVGKKKYRRGREDKRKEKKIKDKKGREEKNRGQMR
jgi:hypothetical protein